MRSNLSLQVKATDILAECDKLRDITLPDLGVLLEDKEGEETVIKLVDKEDLRNGGIVGGDDRSVRVGDQVHVAQMVERSLSM